MKLTNPILITLNNTLHIKADNLEPVEVDSSCEDEIKKLIWSEKRKTKQIDEVGINYYLMQGIPLPQELLDRIEVSEETTHHKSDVIKTYKAFLLPAKEDELSELLEIVDKKFYTIEEIESAIDEAIEIWEHKHIKNIIINNLKK